MIIEYGWLVILFELLLDVTTIREEQPQENRSFADVAISYYNEFDLGQLLRHYYNIICGFELF